jgi:hypothetical protein
MRSEFIHHSFHGVDAEPASEPGGIIAIIGAIFSPLTTHFTFEITGVQEAKIELRGKIGTCSRDAAFHEGLSDPGRLPPSQQIKKIAVIVPEVLPESPIQA